MFNKNLDVTFLLFSTFRRLITMNLLNWCVTSLLLRIKFVPQKRLLSLLLLFRRVSSHVLDPWKDIVLFPDHLNAMVWEWGGLRKLVDFLGISRITSFENYLIADSLHVPVLFFFSQAWTAIKIGIVCLKLCFNRHSKKCFLSPLGSQAIHTCISIRCGPTINHCCVCKFLNSTSAHTVVNFTVCCFVER